MELPGAPEDPEQRSFIDPVWLQQWGLGPENVLDYFSLSPFYNKACNNEQCRMQGVDPREGLLNLTGLEFMLEKLPEEMSFLQPGQPAPVGPQPRRLFVIKRRNMASNAKELQEEMELLLGLAPEARELEVSAVYLAHAQFRKKQIRKSPTSVEVQAIYYVMEGVIYQAPTVQKLIKSRLSKFTHHLNNAFVELSKLAELKDSAGGYDWAWQKETKALQEKAEALEGVGLALEDRDAKAALKLSMDNILMGLVEKYIDGEGEAGGDTSRGVKRKAPVPVTKAGAATATAAAVVIGARNSASLPAKSPPTSNAPR